MPDYKRHGARYRARRRAVDILFEAETRDIDPVAIVRDRVELSQNPQNAVAPVAEYTRVIVSGVAEKLDDLDDAIERHLTEDWELFRLPAVDRQILRVSSWEILFNDEVTPAIAIANALEMATEYAGKQAPPYIHAMLDGITQHAAPNAPFSGEEAGDAFQTEDPSLDDASPAPAQDTFDEIEVAQSTESIDAAADEETDSADQLHPDDVQQLPDEK